MKIGYKVVKKNKSTKPHIWEVVGESNVFKDSVILKCEEQPLLHHEEIKSLRYATKDEIILGKRTY